MRGGSRGQLRHNKMRGSSINLDILAEIAAQISETAVMTAASPNVLPDDLDALRAAVLAERAEKQLVILERDGLVAERDQLSAANDKLHHIIAVLR